MFFSMEKKSYVLLDLNLFAKEIGVPEVLVRVLTEAKISAEVKIVSASIGTTLKMLEQDMPWDNLAELFVSMLKSRVSKEITYRNSPVRL